MASAESEIRSLAVLAHLSLSDDEVREAAGHLEHLLVYIGRIQAIDISEAPEFVSLGEDGERATLPLRPDVARPGLPREVIMAAAPAAPIGLFEVPRVVVRSGAVAGQPPTPQADDEIAP